MSSNTAVGIATNANGGNLQANITNNTIVHGAGSQFRATSGGATSNGHLFFTITGNAMTANNGTAGTGPAVMAYANFDTAIMDGIIGGAGALANSLTNNTPGVGGGGTAVAGVSLTNEGNGSSFVRVENNTITVNDGFGIIANVQGTNTGAGHFHLVDNTVSVVTSTDVANTAVSPANSSSAGTECLNISGNALTTNPGTNFDIVLTNENVAGTFQVQQTAVTTNPPYDGVADNQTVESDISSAQTSGNTIINPVLSLGSFTSGTCTAPSSP